MISVYLTGAVRTPIGRFGGSLRDWSAADLGIAEKTIKVHRARVMEKMRVESLAALVQCAGRLGIQGPAAP